MSPTTSYPLAISPPPSSPTTSSSPLALNATKSQTAPKRARNNATPPPSTRVTRSQVTPRVDLKKALPTVTSTSPSRPAKVTKPKPLRSSSISIRAKPRIQTVALPALTEREDCILNMFFTEVLRRRREATRSSLASPPPSSPVGPPSRGMEFQFIWSPSFNIDPVPGAILSSDGQGRQFEAARTCFKNWKVASGAVMSQDSQKIEDELVSMLREALGTREKMLDLEISLEAVKKAARLMNAHGEVVSMEKEDLDAVRILLLLNRADCRLVSARSSSPFAIPSSHTCPPNG